MANEFLESTSALGTAFSAVAAVLSGWCAFLSYKLSRSMQTDMKSDERIVTGVPIHPELRERSHSPSVVQCTIFNKSHRKAYINSVKVFDQKGKEINVTWSDRIDSVGAPLDPCQLIGIVDASSLFLRRDDGTEVNYARIDLSHSFSQEPQTIIFDAHATFLSSSS
jgi:hypothetical protein